MIRATAPLALVLALAACAEGRDVDSAAATPAPTETPVAAAPTAAPNPAVGGVAMDESRTIVANASAAPNLKTLVAAVQAASLVETLSGPGPFTVFAPTDAAFERLAPGTVDNLLKPENKPSLVKVLTYHVVSGTITSAQLKDRITQGGGSTTLTTVEGEPITATMQSPEVIALADVNGNKSYIEIADVRQSNGVVHVVNGVLVPKLG